MSAVPRLPAPGEVVRTCQQVDGRWVPLVLRVLRVVDVIGLGGGDAWVWVDAVELDADGNVVGPTLALVGVDGVRAWAWEPGS